MSLLISGYSTGEKISEDPRTVVYRAISEDGKKPVIIKTLKSAYPTQRDLFRIKHEYEVLEKLNISGITRAYRLEKYNNGLALVLEHFNGKSLKEFLRTKTFTITEFIPIAIKLSEITGKIHNENIIHKDINPRNIVIGLDTNEVNIIDFGLSTLLKKEEQRDVNPGSLEGTLAYMSPEQTGRMNRAIDYRTDLYSLGVTFYEMLTGTLPFQTNDAMELVHCHIARIPVPPIEINRDMPQVISRIIMKLLAKNAEDRYQSAYGLKSDLDECLKQIKEKEKIANFKIAQRDLSEHFNLSQKFYGRESEIDTLMSGFERASSGSSEMMLVSGYSGVGKSSLVRELHKPIVRLRGYFISGKFDQYKRNIPYSALSQAFQELVQQLLTESEESLRKWKYNLLSALGSNASVIIDIIPEVEHIVGKQPPVLQLGPQETQNRFHLVFQQFIGVFTQKEHPLVIFLDDLQWVDLASLNLIKILIMDSDSKYLFMIGAYRDNEVEDHHPLIMVLDEIQKSGVIVKNISLSPLKNTHINQLISDTLYCNDEKASALSELVMSKTDGNPFFVNQFLRSLYEESLITFDCSCGNWQWDMEEIENKGVTDNVVELMVDKIMCFQEDTQNILQLAACIGNKFDLNTLSIVSEKSPSETTLSLWEGIKEGLIKPMDDSYISLGVGGQDLGDIESNLQLMTPGPQITVPNSSFVFLHDRVQQAAYSLISDDNKKEMHLKIGRLMLKHAKGREEERIFDIVNHLNVGVDLIIDRDEKDELARLNLSAGKKAKASTAYNDGLKYIINGMKLLGENSWKGQYELTLSLYVEGAEAAYLSGDFPRASGLLEIVLKEAKTLLDKVKAYEIRIQFYVAQNMLVEAVDTAIEILGPLGAPLPKDPDESHIQYNMEMTQNALIGKTIEDLKNLPQMTDPHKLAAISILMNTFSSIYFTSPKLTPVMICKLLLLSLKHGNSQFSPFVYIIYGTLLCKSVEGIDSGYRFGKLALIMIEKYNAIGLMSIVNLLFGLHIKHWKEHLNETLESLIEGYNVGMNAGNFEYGCGCASIYVFHMFFLGRELDTLEKEMLQFQEVSKKMKQERDVNAIKQHRQVALNLMGRGTNICRLRGRVFDEDEMLPVLKKANDYAAIGTLYSYKSILCYLFGNYQYSLENTKIAEEYTEINSGSYMFLLSQNFYNSLTLLALFSEMQVNEQKQYMNKVTTNQELLKNWSHHAPMNYLHKYNLVEAELARVNGKDIEAMGLYDKAIKLAGENEYVNEEALANEVAARFHLSKGREKIAKIYMADALYCYYKWGAHAKVKDLEERYPQLLTHESDNRHLTTQMPVSTIISSETRSNDLDLSTVIKASQTISGEIVLGRLLEKMMKIVLENAGAQRGVLIMVKEDELVIEAEGEVGRDEVKVMQSIPLETNGILPTSIIKYTARTQGDVVLNDSAQEGIFTEDYYVKKTLLKSVLCIPIVNKGKLLGILYLENNVTKGAFTSERLELLKILSSQMAISLENALFYSTLEQKVVERTKELKQSQDELVEKEKMAALGRLVTGIAHEVNTPVGVSVTAASTIESKINEFMKSYNSEDINRAEFEDFVNIMNEGVQIISRNLQRAAEQIKSFKQVAVDQTNEIKRQIKVKEYIGDIMLSLDPKLKDKRVVINIDCSDDIVLDSYPGAFSQVITNLVMNSVVHGFDKRDECNINIRCVIDGKDLILCYKDDGRGIDADVLPKIYDPFFTTNRQEGGSGLGLHIIYNLVTQKLNGTINCESEQGKGVLFSMKIPQKASS